MSNSINTPSNSNIRHQTQYALQQYQRGSLLQQSTLPEAPIVYGNSNLHQYYQHPFDNQTIHSYPPQNIIYTPSQVNYYAPPQSEMMTRSSPSSHSSSSGDSPRTPSGSKSAHHSPITSNLATPLETAGVTNSPTTEERIKDTIARANAVPAEFYQTEFFEYSKKSYEIHQSAASKKRKRTTTNDSNQNFKRTNVEPLADDDNDGSEERPNSNELRRQIHIQSEQKRRAQIKDGFEILKSHLPGCANKKMSKATLLARTVQQLEHMKKMQSELLAEVERLAEENLNLKSGLSRQVPY